MSNDFLKQLNQRPKVPPRTDEEVQNNPEVSVPRNNGTTKSVYKDIEESGIKTVRSSLLLEESMHFKFRDWCNRNGIIRACWVEAAMIIAEKDPQLLKQIEELAKELTSQRKEEADDKRRVTMWENRKKTR
jgi:hypothetical protein